MLLLGLVIPFLWSAKAATIYHNGLIITMEAEGDEVAAVVVEDGKIVFAGDVDVAIADYGEGADYVDLEGQTMMPGFIEPHVHPAIAGIVLANEIIAPYNWETPDGTAYGVQNETGWRERAAEAIRANAVDEKMFLIWGFTQYWHGNLTRELLDEVEPDKPVGVLHRSMHEIYLNTGAMKFLKLEKSKFDSNKQVNWDEGHFWEGGWMSLTPYLAEVFFLDKGTMEYTEGLEAMTWLFQKNGIICGAEPGVPNSDINFEMNTLLAETIDAPYDFYLIPGASFWKAFFEGDDQAALEYIEDLPDNSEWNTDKVGFVRKHVKLFADGAIYSQLSQFEDGYLDKHEGEWITPVEEFKEMFKLYWRNNYRIHIHTNGDAGANMVMETVREAMAEDKENRVVREKPHKTTMHHLAYFTEEQAKEMAELGMVASVNPFYLWALADKYMGNLGEERATNMVAMRYLTENNVPLSFHSDFSMAPAEPLTLAWTAINRQTSQGNVFEPELGVSVYDALKAITIEAAAVLDMEESLGSIKVGKDGSFVILDRNPYVEPETMNEIKVMAVIYKGEYYSNDKYWEPKEGETSAYNFHTLNLGFQPASESDSEDSEDPLRELARPNCDRFDKKSCNKYGCSWVAGSCIRGTDCARRGNRKKCNEQEGCKFNGSSMKCEVFTGPSPEFKRNDKWNSGCNRNAECTLLAARACRSRADCTWFGRSKDGQCFEGVDLTDCRKGKNRRKCNTIKGCVWRKGDRTCEEK